VTPAAIRWIHPRDMLQVAGIEQASFPVPMTDAELRKLLGDRHRGIVGHVAHIDELVVGYSMYELHTDRVDIVSVAVHPDHRRSGVGRKLFRRCLISQDTGRPRRDRVTAVVHERNDAAVRFLAACGLRAVGLVRDPYPDLPGDDGYVFEWRRAAVLEPECVGK
jgi:ribosomal protein S18 acetylase RimI-like enzyme